MDIVLNEYKWAENAIRERCLGKKPAETLTRVAKYYFNDGMKKQDVRVKIEEFLKICDPLASSVKWSDALDRAVKYAEKYPAIVISGVDVTSQEISSILSIDGKQAQRLAFTLLCISKYISIVNPSSDHWVNMPDSKIMKMANISTSVRRQSALYKQLKDMGLIRFSKKIDNLSVQVLFAGGEDKAITVRDYRNLGYQLNNYIDGGYFSCECCGLFVKVNNTRGARKKYCTDCAKRMRMIQNVNSVMRIRECHKK